MYGNQFQFGGPQRPNKGSPSNNMNPTNSFNNSNRFNQNPSNMGSFNPGPGSVNSGPYPTHSLQPLQPQPQKQRYRLLVSPTPTYDGWQEEKDKIIKDVYSKTVPDPRTGQPVLDVKYVYHMKIKEYSSYPQLMPPMGLPQGQLGPVKDRILCICAKHLGRVLIQKGKYNDHKYVYQIGRTWDIDELKEIVRSGSDGLVLVLNKNYYWRVSEGRERLVLFVTTLARTYGSYTGRYPVITGFDSNELNLPQIPVKSGAPATEPTVGLGLAKDSLRTSGNDGGVGPPPHPMQLTEPSYSSSSLSSHHQSPAPAPAPAPIPAPIPGASVSASVPFPVVSSAARGPQSSRAEKTKSHPYSNLVAGATQESLATSEDNFNFGNSNEPLKRHPSQATVIHHKKNSELSQSSGSPLSKPFSQLADPGPIESLSASRKDAQQDSDIEEISDHSSVDWNSPKAPGRNAELSPIDSSIQEIEAFMDKQLGKQYQADMPIVPEIVVPSEDEEHPALNIKKKLARSDSDHPDPGSKEVGSYSMYPEEEALLPSMVPDEDDETSETSEERLQRDPEIEELMEELKWDIVEGSELLVKKLTKKLNQVKLTNARNLVNFDFGKQSVFDDIDFSLREVNNLSHIFTKLSIDVRGISSKVAFIEHESDGLQMRTINEEMLLNELQSIVDDLNIDDRELKVISTFRQYDNFNSLSDLEGRLVRLYAALDTIRDNDAGGLNKMRAIKQYQEAYEDVASRFSENFLAYFKDQVLYFINGIIPTVSKIGPTDLFQDFNKWTVLSGLILFVKDISHDKFVSMREAFNKVASDLVNEWLKFRLQEYHKVKIAEANAKEAAAATASSTPSQSPELSLIRKSSGLRLSTRKERLISRLSGINVGDSKYEVERNVFLLIYDTLALVQSFAYVLTTLFHYPMDGHTFPTYVELEPFEDRAHLSQVHTFVEIHKLYRQCTSDLVNNMLAIFGNYVIQFSKVVIPSETFVLKVIRALEKATVENFGNAMQDFLVFNFIKKLKDKYINLWNRYVQAQVDEINQSIISSKIQVLPCVKRIISVIQILETQALEKALSATTGTLGSPALYGDYNDADSGSENGALLLKIAESSYTDITVSLSHLFEREDPLLKNSDFDDQERGLRNVSIILNTFYLTDHLQIGNKALTKLIGTLYTYYEQSKKVFFNGLISKSIGRLVEFVNTHSQPNRVKYNKKAVRQALSGYEVRSLSPKVQETYRKMQSLFYVSDSGVERALVEKLWGEYEVTFNDIITRTMTIVRREYPDVEFNIQKSDVRTMFKSALLQH